MARSHAKLFCSIWEDDDFLALPSAAQRLYMLLMSQRKTTMVGCLDLKPARWARLAPDTTIDDIRQAARVLHEARFVVLDEETDELVIRTLVRHDGLRITANSKLLKGFWSQWEAIESPALRMVVIDHIPDDVWGTERVPPPAAALEMRRSGPPEPPVPSGGSNRDRESVPSNGSNHGTDPVRAHVPPSAFRLPPSAVNPPSSLESDSGSPTGRAGPDPSPAPPATAPALALVEPLPIEPDALVPQTTWDLFWQRWPCKHHKQAARSAWNARRRSGVSDAEILAGLDRWNAYWRADGTEDRHIPHAARWLKERYWREPTPSLARRRSSPARPRGADYDAEMAEFLGRHMATGTDAPPALEITDGRR